MASHVLNNDISVIISNICIGSKSLHNSACTDISTYMPSNLYGFRIYQPQLQNNYDIITHQQFIILTHTSRKSNYISSSNLTSYHLTVPVYTHTIHMSRYIFSPTQGDINLAFVTQKSRTVPHANQFWKHKWW